MKSKLATITAALAATMHLSAGLRRLVPDSPGEFSGVLLDPRARAAIATDGAAIAIVPFPEGFTVDSPRFLPGSEDSGPHDITPADGLPTDADWGWEAVEEMIAASPSHLPHHPQSCEAPGPLRRAGRG